MSNSIRSETERAMEKIENNNDEDTYFEANESIHKCRSSFISNKVKWEKKTVYNIYNKLIMALLKRVSLS